MPGRTLPAKPQSLLKTSLRNWNKLFGKNVEMEGWSYYGEITTKKQANDIRDEMTDPLKVYFPSWQASEPNKMRILRIRDDRTVTRNKVKKWQEMVRKSVKVGQHAILIRWKNNQKGKLPKTFETTCVVDKKSIVYDSMLSNTVTVDSHSRCFDYHIGWIWQTNFADMTRGKIWADCNPVCSPNGTLISCDFDCGGDMVLGDAKCAGSVAPVPGTNCCNLSYSWGWGTPLITVSVTIVAGKSTVVVSGSLGSKGSGMGACTCCCAATPVRPPRPTSSTTVPSGSNRPREVSIAGAMCNEPCYCQGPSCGGNGPHCTAMKTEPNGCATDSNGKCVRRAGHVGPHKCNHTDHYFSTFRF
jgi:hypothetical protein